MLDCESMLIDSDIASVKESDYSSPFVGLEFGVWSLEFGKK